jgi:hypothetical protein
LILKIIFKIKGDYIMPVVENFAAVPAKEQREFATALVNKVNTEGIFTKDAKFEIVDIYADDITGGLVVELSHAEPIEVTRKATWTCDSEDDIEDGPGYEADYSSNIYNDAEKAFNTLSTVIDGYKVSLEISEVDEGDNLEVEVDRISHEDAGIGDYEYFGFTGTDSDPYVEVEGTVVRECYCSLALIIEPNDIAEIEPTEEV